MWEEVKKPVLWTVLTFSLVYSIMCYFSYQGLRMKEERITLLEEKMETNADFKTKRDYNMEIDQYEHNKTLLQTFWMKHFFEFEEFEKIK